jgi:hypothetical protein
VLIIYLHAISQSYDVKAESRSLYSGQGEPKYTVTWDNNERRKPLKGLLVPSTGPALQTAIRTRGSRTQIYHPRRLRLLGTATALGFSQDTVS